jgi:chromosome segregation ATPase
MGSAVGLEVVTVPLIALAGTFVGWVANSGWKARGIKSDLEKRIDETRDSILREAGEGLTALRTKVTTMELETERNFVRRPDFQNAIDSFTRSIADLRADIKNDRAEIKEEYSRLIEKIDKIDNQSGLISSQGQTIAKLEERLFRMHQSGDSPR